MRRYGWAKFFFYKHKVLEWKVKLPDPPIGVECTKKYAKCISDLELFLQKTNIQKVASKKAAQELGIADHGLLKILCGCYWGYLTNEGFQRLLIVYRLCIQNCLFKTCRFQPQMVNIKENILFNREFLKKLFQRRLVVYAFFEQTFGIERDVARLRTTHVSKLTKNLD